MSKVCDKENAVKVEIVYTELTQEQEQAMFNFFKSRSFPRIIKKTRRRGAKKMLTAVLITLSLGIVMNIALYAYQKGWEKKNVDTDLDSDCVDTRVTRSDKPNRKC